MLFIVLNVIMNKEVMLEVLNCVMVDDRLLVFVIMIIINFIGVVVNCMIVFVFFF